MHRHEACQSSSARFRGPVSDRRSPFRRCVHRTAVLLAAMPAAWFAAPAFALDGGVVNAEAFASQRYDSNLFALPDGVEPPGGTRRSATTFSSGATLRIDKAYGLQQFDLYGTITHVHYNPYDYLDLTSHAYGGRWAWTLTPSLTGNIAIDESRTPNSFSNTGFQTAPNPQTLENRRFDVNYRIGEVEALTEHLAEYAQKAVAEAAKLKQASLAAARPHTPERIGRSRKLLLSANLVIGIGIVVLCVYRQRRKGGRVKDA